MSGGPAQGYLRFPTVAGGTVVFTCADDLWSVPATGGVARRLTAGRSEASRPRLSPDGRQVVFTASDDGPTELYLLPTDGPARRLTHMAARSAPVGWHPATGEILFASTAAAPAGFGNRLFALHPDGGPARVLDVGPADTIGFRPDGGVVLGRNTADPARWKRYRGGLAGELWIASTVDGPYRRLISLPGNLGGPCPAGERIFFVADHEGIGNVYSCCADGTDLTRHTDHRDFYARNLSGDGQTLVYHAGGRLFALDAATGVARPLRVEVPGARTQCARRFVPAGEYTEDARLGPGGHRVAITARGKVFTFAPFTGPVRRHGEPDGVRHRLVDWCADGTRLVVVAADERAAEHVMLLDAEGGGQVTELATGDVGMVTELRAAPKGGLVAFCTGRQQLWLADVTEPRRAPVLLDASRVERIEDLAWSTDGRWLAYTRPESQGTSAIVLADTTTGATTRLAEPVLRDFRPAFDPGGRYLYFLGQRELTPDADQVRFDIGFPFGVRPYVVPLRAGDPGPFRSQPGDREPVSDVVVDLAGIADRIVPCPVPEGRYAAVLGVPGGVLLHSVPLRAPDPEQPEDGPNGTVTLLDFTTGRLTPHLDGVDGLTVEPAGELLLHRTDSRLRVVRTREVPADDDTPGRSSGWLDLDRVRVPLDPVAEWRQMFAETWRLQREGFWDAGMSGVDWTAARERYTPLLDLVATRAELSDLLWELQAELGTSHAYEQGGEYRPVTTQSQGFLGVDWAAGPGWRIGRILRGDPWLPAATSPCLRPGAGIRCGDEVLAVNGVPVGPAGPGEHLVGQAGHDVELLVRSGTAAPRPVTVCAIGDESRARYRDVVAHRRAVVHETSQGRLGYVHVPDMFAGGYAEFVRGFLNELDRDGLVVDVRFNSGGHVSPLILDRLSRRRTGAEHGRWSGVAPYPVEAAAGPMALLVNEHTGSDAELFAHAFRTLGLGPLVGRRTWGGVIATWPRHLLVDGTITTQPEFRHELIGTGGRLENHGLTPDIEVDDLPGKSTRDGQLLAAVAHLLTELDPPTVPATIGDVATPALTRARSRRC